MYESVKSCVRVNGSLTDYFDSYMGVKQGEPLSPLLFILFVNDMNSYLNDLSGDVFTLDQLQIFLLLFADDTAIFAYSKERLQQLLNKLHCYCKEWGITVNKEKTVVMVFKKGGKLENIDIFYDSCKLQVVKTFKYLGVNLSSNGCFYQAQKCLSVQASRALYSLNTLFDTLSLNVSEKIKLFDSMIMPILSYGCEVWGFHKSPDIEKIHLKFLKQLLGVHGKTPNTAVYGEFGRYPLLIMRHIRIIKYWFRIMKVPDSLMFKLVHMTDENGNLVNSWSIEVKSLLSKLGFMYLWNYEFITNIHVTCIVQRIVDHYIQSWRSDLNAFSRLESYRYFKTNFEFENYLNFISNDNIRILLSRLRCSAHKLAIEEGRCRNIERTLRICKLCDNNQVESEFHFLLICPLYSDIRQKYLSKYYYTWPTLNKFRMLMNTNSRVKLNKLALYIFHANKLREGKLKNKQ